jgi:arginase
VSRSSDRVLLGVPIDSVGEAGGTEHGPVALRAALAGAGLADAGDTERRLRGGRRDPETGWQDFDQVLEMTSEVRARVAELIGAGRVPIVLGGCCSLLPGALAGARDALGDCGLAFIDGHMDTYEGHTSPTGEAADMPVAALLGHAPPPLVERLGPTPVAVGSRISLLGSRDPEEAADVSGPGELGIVDHRDRESLRGADLGAVGVETAHRHERAGRFWVHLDVDVLDQAEFPATDYLMPDGLTLAELEALLAPLLSSPALAGVNLTCFNPDKDTDGEGAAALARLLGPSLSSRRRRR